MQPTEGMSIPRRALDVEDYIDIIRRHKGWIFGPFLFTLTFAYFIGAQTPLHLPGAPFYRLHTTKAVGLPRAREHGELYDGVA